MLTIVYSCYPCKKEYDPNELSELVEIDDGDWEHLCPDCGKPVVWGLCVTKT